MEGIISLLAMFPEDASNPKQIRTGGNSCPKRGRNKGSIYFVIYNLFLRKKSWVKKIIIIKSPEKVLCFLVRLHDVINNCPGPWQEQGQKRRLAVEMRSSPDSWAGRAGSAGGRRSVPVGAGFLGF